MPVRNAKTASSYLSRLLILLPLLAAAGTAYGKCHDDWMCVDEVRTEQGVSFQARNLRSVPLTYTLSVRRSGEPESAAHQMTETLQPQAASLALSFDDPTASFEVHVRWTIGDMHANHDDDHLYAFPYERGRSFRILQAFDSRFSHRGLENFAVDFDMPVGTPVHAARGGIVARVVEEHSRGCWKAGCGQYANYIVILHTDGTTGEYYHLRQDGALVEPGDAIARGQRIGYSGNTGHTALPHLHFAVYRASSDGETQSIPIRFQSAEGVIAEPRSGGRYLAAH